MDSCPRVLLQFEFPSETFEDQVAEVPLVQDNKIHPELIPVESDIFTVNAEPNPITSPAFGCRERDGFCKSTEPLFQVIGPSLPRRSTLLQANMND